MSTAYAYDKTAELADNLIKKEVHAIADYPNEFNCIIPTFAPFFRNDFILTHKETGRRLYEGLDYYFGHYYLELAETVKLPIYGSIMLMDNTLTGSIEFTQYRTTGGGYTTTQDVIHTYLGKEDNPDPRNTDWADVLIYKQPVSAVALPVGIDEAIAADVVTEQLAAIVEAVTQANDDEREGWDRVIASLKALSAKIVSTDISVHDKRKNAHSVTYAQLGAIKKDGDVVNAINAYGYSLANLMVLVNEMNQATKNTDELASLTGDILSGRLSYENDTLSIKNSDGTATITAGGTIALTTNSDVLIESDNSDLGTVIGAGNNQLSIHSNPGTEGAVFNGFFIIHGGNLNNYLPTLASDTSSFHTEDTSTVAFTGDGSIASPLVGTVYYPRASLVDSGVFRLSHSIYSSNTTVASSSYAIKLLNELIGGRLDKSVKVNNHALSGNITVTKGDLGLGNVDNTGVEDKPASDAFKAAASQLGDATHTHDINDLTGIPYASTTEIGLAKLNDTISDDETTALTPGALTEIVSEVGSLQNSVNQYIQGSFFDIMQYGGFDYLPLPVAGNFAAVGTDYIGFVGCFEASGKFVMLRNGVDALDSGIFYWYCTFKSDGTFDKTVASSYEYAPDFLEDGERASWVATGTEGIFILGTDVGNIYIVLTAGTMDASKHTAMKISISGYSRTEGVIHLNGTDIYISQLLFNKNTGISYTLWKTSTDYIGSSETIVVDKVPLSGTNMQGQVQKDVTTYMFVNDIFAESADDNPMVIVEDMSLFSTYSVYSSSTDCVSCLEGNLIRHYGVYLPQASSASLNRAFYQEVGLRVDLDNFTVIDERAEANIPTPTITSSNGLEDYTNVTPPSGYTNSSYGIAVVEYNNGVQLAFLGAVPGQLMTYKDDGTKLFDRIKVPATKRDRDDTTYVNGTYGSLATSYAASIGFIDGDKMILNQSSYDSFLVAKYDRNGSYGENVGWGPTTERELLTRTEYEEMLRVPRCFDDSNNRGTVLTDYVSSAATRIDNQIPTDYISWNDAFIASVKTKFNALSTLYGFELIDEKLTLHIFGDILTDNTKIAILSYEVIEYSDSTKTAIFATSYRFRVNVTVSNNVVTAIENIESISSYRHASNSRDFNIGRDNDFFDSYGMNSIATLPDGNTIVVLNYGNLVNNLGSRSFTISVYIYDPSNNLVSKLERWRNPANKHGWIYHPDFGLGLGGVAYRAEAVTVSAYGKTTSEIQANYAGTYESFLIHASNVATGLILYFTEEARFYCNSIEYTVPTQTIDLNNAGLTKVTDATIYIYVELVDQVVTYHVSNQKLEDTTTQLYIGYCITDDTQIVTINVEPATRLGNIYELIQHNDDPDAHPGFGNITKDTYGLGNVENMAMINSLELPTFKEVFDSWTRFSHDTTTTRPAKASELLDWEYNESSDTISCTINSTTFIGFVSIEEVSDYTFDTLVGSPNADNDGLIVVLAYKEIGGIEYTICAVRARSTEAHMNIDSRFDIWYNYHQADAVKLATVTDAVDSLGGWSGNYARIIATREGNDFVVKSTPFVKSTSLADFDLSTVETVHTFSLDDLDILNKFKGSNSFGYGAMSQPSSTFINILRPDEDYSNYYISADIVRGLADVKSGTTAFRQGQVANGADVPIPEGFTADDCKITVTPYQTMGDTDASYGNIRAIDTTLSDRGVSASMSVTTDVGTSTNNILTYYLVARKEGVI